MFNSTRNLELVEFLYEECKVASAMVLLFIRKTVLDVKERERVFGSYFR